MKKPGTIHNRLIDQFRVLLCLAVFLYHLGILKGGYLAVCGFFVLSGYLSIRSLRRKKRLTYKNYYLSRSKRLYLPLLVTVFVTVALISLIPGIIWVDMKAETTSVIFAYNNFYQLISGSDYFVRSSDTPFTHMWYIAILLQFDLLLPLIYVLLRKTARRLSRIIPIIILGSVAITSCIVFTVQVSGGHIMNAYYGTFSRSFAFLFGMAMAFSHFYLPPLVIDNKPIEKILFYIESGILFVLFVLIDSSSDLFVPMMFVSTFLSMRIIDHAIYLNEKTRRSDLIITALSSLSYEIYLVQYPIIFILNSFDIPVFVRIVLSLILTPVMAFIFNQALSFERPSLKKIYKPLLSVMVIVLCLSGVYRFVVSSDNKQEMKELQDKLDENQKLIDERNQEFREKEKSEAQEWKQLYESEGSAEDIVKEMLKKMPLTAIGDSIMIDIAEEIYDFFPNAYVDGLVSRDLYHGNQILQELKDEGNLSDHILLSLSVNGDFRTYLCEQLIEIIEGRDIYWIDAVGADDPSFNRLFEEFASDHENIHIIRWQEFSKDHPEYFYFDGIHVMEEGVTALNTMVYDTVYENCLKTFEERRNEALARKEDEAKQRSSFYGNDVLTGVYPYLNEISDKATYNILSDLNSDSIIKKFEDDKRNGELEYQVIILFDSSVGLKQKDYEKIISFCDQHKVIVFDLYGRLKDMNKVNVTIIDLSEKIMNDKQNLLSDKVHLSEKGNTILSKEIMKVLADQ